MPLFDPLKYAYPSRRSVIYAKKGMAAPRFQWVGGKRVQLEREVPAHVARKLAEMGHRIEVVNTNGGMGRGQIIWRLEDGALAGGTEPRADGTIAAW